MDSSDARVGRWVMHAGKPAIIFRLGPDKLPNRKLEVVEVAAGSALIHYVDPKTGETVADAVAPLGALKRAALDDIPEVRRPKPAPQTH